VSIDKAEQLLKDRRLSLRELFGSLNVLLERVHPSMVELGMSQMCARWVLRDLSDEQKRNCAEVCQQSVTFF
jgi:hypothetical protein